jgi:hypothetical protein
MNQAEQVAATCDAIKSDTFLYVGGQPATPLKTQKYSVKKLRGRSIAGIPIPGGSGDGPRYEVQVAKKPQPVAVAESRPLFHFASETPVDRVVAVRLTGCGNNDCFNLYQDGPAVMSLVRLEWRRLGQDCYEFVPEQSLNPGNYALIILGRDWQPEQVARFIAGPSVPTIDTLQKNQ